MVVGNMIVIYNVVVVLVMVGFLGKEGLILCKIIILILYYVGLVGILGLLVIYLLDFRDLL